MTTDQPNRTYYPALDGLRGLAILLIVFYHNFGFINYFFFGWLGVDLFFVLSGFLITDILLKTKNDQNYLRNFYARRVLRIFPLYYLTLLLFIIILPAFNNNLNLNYYQDNQLWFWSYLQNWLFIFHPPPPATEALSHLWSLAVEEQFYLIWPLVILIFKKPKTLFYLLIVVLVGVILLRFFLWTYKIENIAYFNLYTFSRIDGLCIGSMLALLRIINPRIINRYFSFIVLALALLNFIFFLFNRQNQFSFPYLAIAGYTTFAVIFALLVNEGVESENSFINKVFSISLLKFFGKISYGLYIFHWPLYLVIRSFFEESWKRNIQFIDASVLISLMASLLGIFIAWLSYRFFESPILSLKKNFT